MSNDSEGIKELISVVLPVYNEEKNIPIITEQIFSVFNSHLADFDFEIIFVNDGSGDASLAALEKAAVRHPNVRVLSFSRNFGHQMALTAGYDHASGDAIICMDSDLQHPPQLIPELIKKWKNGYDIVYTVRISDKKISFARRSCSDFFYFLINSLSKTKINKNAADFRLISRSAMDEFLRMREFNRFIRGMVGWIGFKTTFIEYKLADRIHGSSGYSLIKLLRFAVDAITSFSGMPLRFSFLLGSLIASASFIYGVYLIIDYSFFGARFISGWLSVLVSILFLGGIQLIFMGIVGEYIYKIYSEIKQRPLYIIGKKFNINK